VLERGGGGVGGKDGACVRGGEEGRECVNVCVCLGAWVGGCVWVRVCVCVDVSTYL
jgi:hypothetical protein